MGLFDWVYDDPDFKKFESAYKDGRVTTKKSFYWGPIGLDWYQLAPPAWSMTALPVPKVPLPFGVSGANPWMLYPEVKKAGRLLAPIYGNELYWDPSSGGWVTIRKATQAPAKDPMLPPCVPDMKRRLEALDQLYAQRTLQEQEWRQQRTLAIESCLGSGPG